MKTIFAAASAAFLLAAPAFAAEEYQSGPALALHDQVAAFDTGSAQSPHFNGQNAVSTPRERVVLGSGSEASVESPNSETVALAIGAAPSSVVSQ
jgi:opacity protein-like surface antigen